MRTIDFFKKFDLPQPTAGLVYKITSPRGVVCRGAEMTEYKLHTQLLDIYSGHPIKAESGVYSVTDVCNIYGTMRWNHYIFYIGDEKIVPIAEFLSTKDTEWVKEAVPIIKKAMLKGIAKTIKITQFPVEESKGWDEF